MKAGVEEETPGRWVAELKMPSRCRLQRDCEKIVGVERPVAELRVERLLIKPVREVVKWKS